MNKTESFTVPAESSWYKSSYSGAEGGQCIEIAAGESAVHVRDSKTVAGPVLSVSHESWAGFVQLAVAAGHM